MTDLTSGDKAPDFVAKDQDGKQHSLADYRGRRLILFFYPRDLTATCVIEACNLRDNYSKLRRKGFELLGVSNDDEKMHKRFVNRHQLPFSLLSDPDRKIVNAYKVFGEKKFMGRIIEGIYRTTFVIDKKGMIEHVITKVRSKEHAEQILEVLEK